MSSRRNQLSKEQVKQLEQLRASFWDEVRKRATAILELNQGSSLRTVAQNSDVSMSTVSRWWKSWEEDGAKGLIPKHLREAGAIKLENERDLAHKEAEENYERWVNANATIDQLKVEIANVQKERDNLQNAFDKPKMDLYNGWSRERKKFVNYKKRAEREKNTRPRMSRSMTSPICLTTA